MKVNIPIAAAVLAGAASASPSHQVSDELTSTAAITSAVSPTVTSTLLASATSIVDVSNAVFVNRNPFEVVELAVSAERHTHENCWPKLSGDYIDWKTYNANGVNLGCWLELEYSCYEEWWASLGTNATDEWSLCEQLGPEKCADICEIHYSTFITTTTIDALAAVGVNTLRIPSTYAAWVRVPGSELYHGHQRKHLKHIMDHAIKKHRMHVTLGLHSLPGGVNDLDIGEAYGHDAWFFSPQNLIYSLQAVKEMLKFTLDHGFQKWVTIEPINEAANDFDKFGTCDGLTAEGKKWVASYINLVLTEVALVDARIPVMLQDCFCGEATWTPYFSPFANLVIDTHVYYFADAGVYSQYVAPAVCGQAATLAGDGVFPVFVGEWSLQTTYNNTFANRATIFDTQRYAWSKYVHGGAFWSAIHYGNATVPGQGEQQDYWSYLGLIESGVITSTTSNSYC